MRATRDHDQNSYLYGTYNAICDVCGFKKKAVDMLHRWDGLFVCKDDFETRHLLDFGKAPRDSIGVDDPRPDPEPKFIDVNWIPDILTDPDPVWVVAYQNEISASYSGGPVYGVNIITDTYNIHQNYGGGLWSVYKLDGLPYLARFSITVLTATPSDKQVYLTLNNTPLPVTVNATLADNNKQVLLGANTTFNALSQTLFAPSSGQTVTARFTVEIQI